jgi:hypothetical protein
MGDEQTTSLEELIPADYYTLFTAEFLPCSELVAQMLSEQNTPTRDLQQALGTYKKLTYKAAENIDNLHRAGASTRRMHQRSRQGTMQHPHMRGLDLVLEIYEGEDIYENPQQNALALFTVMHQLTVEHLLQYVPKARLSTT